jgi:hypothetical protein
VARAVEELSGAHLAVVPVAGPWSAQTVVSLVGVVASSVAGSPTGCTLVANVRTGRLWGSRPGPALLLDHLSGRPVQPPEADWDCGHFVGIAGSVGGPGGALVIVRDTYRQLGWDGYHLQPAGAMAEALSRGDGKEGGVLCVCEAAAAGALARELEGAGFELRHWDNGSADPGKGVKRWGRSSSGSCTPTCRACCGDGPCRPRTSKTASGPASGGSRPTRRSRPSAR